MKSVMVLFILTLVPLMQNVFAGAGQPAQDKPCIPGCTDGLACDNTNGKCVPKKLPERFSSDLKKKLKEEKKGRIEQSVRNSTTT
jgi:hypothetical protein